MLLCLMGAAAFAAPPPGYRLVWSDEFRQEPGAKPDPARWRYDLGAGGWGNEEQQTYTDSADNACIIRDPFATDGRALEIVARRESDAFTSARILTLNKYAVQYGYIEARIRIPRGQGLWPAFWMLGADLSAVGWPACGEIDVMENVGKDPNRAHGTVHGPGHYAERGITAAYALPDNEPFHRRYHLFAVEWAEDTITFLVDGQKYHTVTPADLPQDSTWAFNKPFFLILNVAVGGRWPGNPDATTQFPQSMRVDYVRAYQRTTASPKPL